MSGHNKWSNIQGRKMRKMPNVGKFSKSFKEIYMAAKAGGPDPQ